jgi:DNA-binding XRE family transcriptional regulator
MVLFPPLRHINIIWQFGILRNGILIYKHMPRALYKEEHQKIVERLKKARIEAGLDQVEVAEKLGRTQSYVSKIESGQRRFDVLQLKEFAKLYKKDIDFFIK